MDQDAQLLTFSFNVIGNEKKFAFYLEHVVCIFQHFIYSSKYSIKYVYIVVYISILLTDAHMLFKDDWGIHCLISSASYQTFHKFSKDELKHYTFPAAKTGWSAT